MRGATAGRIADAALEVLGTGGIHALSHARVDATAGLPAGSASNHFRTRAALMAGAVARLREGDAEAWRATLEAPRPTDRDELARVLAAFVVDATGPARIRTAARCVIFVQGVVEPSLLVELNADRRLVTGWLGSVLVSLGLSAEPAELLLATVEGLIMHRLTGFAVDPPGPLLTKVLAGWGAGHAVAEEFDLVDQAGEHVGGVVGRVPARVHRDADRVAADGDGHGGQVEAGPVGE